MLFRRFHRDAYMAILGVLVLAGLITYLLVALNPVR